LLSGDNHNTLKILNKAKRLGHLPLN